MKTVDDTTLPADGWIQTFCGHRVWPLRAAGTFDLIDIAQALSHICRFGGHTRRFYSVAQHSVLASRICDPAAAAWCLMHDAAEAYIGDLVRPMKRSLRYWDDDEYDYPSIQVAELNLLRRIGETLGLPEEMPSLEIDRVDNLLLANERAQLLNVPPHEVLECERVDLTQAANLVPITEWDSRLACAEFLHRAQELGITP